MEYVVKNPNRLQYAQSVRMPKPEEYNSAEIESWTSCQRCAARFTRDEAHEIAHGHGGALRVVRIKSARK